MKKLFIFILYLGFNTPLLLNAQVKALELDSDSSYMQWAVKNNQSNIKGSVLLKSGSLLVENNIVTSGSFSIDLNSINFTDTEEKLDKHEVRENLARKSFFYTEQFPEAQIQIIKTKAMFGTKDQMILVFAKLNIKGISQDIEFPAKISNTAEKFVADAELRFDRFLWDLHLAKSKKDKALDNYIGVKLHVELH